MIDENFYYNHKNFRYRMRPIVYKQVRPFVSCYDHDIITFYYYET